MTNIENFKSANNIRERKTFHLPDSKEEVASTLFISEMTHKDQETTTTSFNTSENHPMDPIPEIYLPRTPIRNSPAKEIKKSISFAGFGAFKTDENEAVTLQELNDLMDTKKKEVNKITKEQIKAYAAKYRNPKHHHHHHHSGEGRPWYR